MTGTRGWMFPGLMALLVVVGVAGGCQDSLKRDRDALMVQNQELQGDLDRTRMALDAAQAEREQLIAELQRAQAAAAAQQAQQQQPAAPQPTAPAANAGFQDIAGTETIRGRGTITVRVPGDVLFASGSADLRAPSRRTLQQIAAVIKRDYAGNRIRIEGHTDSDPIRKTRNLWRDNYHLSEARARSVRDFLASQGVPNGNMAIVGHGADKPVASNRDATGKQRNRRVEIVVLVAD